MFYHDCAVLAICLMLFAISLDFECVIFLSAAIRSPPAPSSRATVVGGFGAPVATPRLVAVDLAQPVPSAVLGLPHRGIEGPDVDRVPEHVSRRGRSDHPSDSLLFRAVLGDRLTKL